MSCVCASWKTNNIQGTVRPVPWSDYNRRRRTSHLRNGQDRSLRQKRTAHLSPTSAVFVPGGRPHRVAPTAKNGVTDSPHPPIEYVGNGLDRSVVGLLPTSQDVAPAERSRPFPTACLRVVRLSPTLMMFAPGGRPHRVAPTAILNVAKIFLRTVKPMPALLPCIRRQAVIFSEQSQRSALCAEKSWSSALRAADQTVGCGST